MKVKDKEVYKFGEALYRASCACGEKLDWEASFDADGTNYGACCCGKYFHMSPHSVYVTIEDE